MIRIAAEWVVLAVVLFAILIAGCNSGGDDDDTGPPSGDDDTADDDTNFDDDQADDDIVDDDAGDDTADDDAVDDDTTDDDIADDDTGDDDTTDDDITDDDAIDDDTSDDDTADDDTTDDDTADDDTGDDDTFVGCVTGEFTAYFGNLHAHSSFSDGEGTPEEAYAYARDEGHLDIFALTDHLEQLYLPFPPGKWETIKETAASFYEPGVYVPLAGYEYGSGFELIPQPPFFMSTGHDNVFFVDYLFPIIQLDYHNFFTSLIECPTCYASFNHPGDDQSNWNDFEYNGAVDAKINLFELSGAGDPWPIYFDALDKGWHISPVWDEDNHSADWGTKDDHRAGMWLAELTIPEVNKAVHDRRTFSTLDKNATISLKTVGGCWMGSDIHGSLSASLIIEVRDPDSGDGFETIELYTRGQTLLGQNPCNGETICTWAVDVTLDQSGYVLARAIQTDGDILVSAPIWLYE